MIEHWKDYLLLLPLRPVSPLRSVQVQQPKRDFVASALTRFRKASTSKQFNTRLETKSRSWTPKRAVGYWPHVSVVYIMSSTRPNVALVPSSAHACKLSHISINGGCSSDNTLSGVQLACFEQLLGRSERLSFSQP